MLPGTVVARNHVRQASQGTILRPRSCPIMHETSAYVKRLLTYTAEFGRSMYFRLALSSGWCRDHNAFVRILSTTMNL